MKRYKTIVIDPPWKYGVWGKGSDKCFKSTGFTQDTNVEYSLPFQYMTIEEIKSLPVYQLGDVNCEVYLWTTQRYLPTAFQITGHWGLKYCTTLTWCKTARGKGQGGVYTPTTEFVLHCRKGKMPLTERIDTTWFHAKRPHNNHSAKPEFFQTLVESVSEEPRLEMFARRQRSGWDVFGNEVENSINIEVYRNIVG